MGTIRRILTHPSSYSQAQTGGPSVCEVKRLAYKTYENVFFPFAPREFI